MPTSTVTRVPTFTDKQKCKKKLRSKPERDNIIKDRLLLRQNDDKDETSSTTTDSSTGDLEEKVIFCCTIKYFLSLQ